MKEDPIIENRLRRIEAWKRGLARDVHLLDVYLESLKKNIPDKSKSSKISQMDLFAG